MIPIPQLYVKANGPPPHSPMTPKHPYPAQLSNSPYYVIATLDDGKQHLIKIQKTQHGNGSGNRPFLTTDPDATSPEDPTSQQSLVTKVLAYHAEIEPFQ